MFKKIVCVFFVLAITFHSDAQQTQAVSVNIGDPAPPVKVRKWIKGIPVNSFEKGKVYVVEFWATWCLPCIAGMPHLSELAYKYKDQVIVSGISILERKNTTYARVDAFVDSMGKKMDYNVAAEDSNYMAQNWLKAAGERGIPFAFVIDQQGRIAWMGHPRKLDKVLSQIVNRKWNITQAYAERKEQKRIASGEAMAWDRLNKFAGIPGKPDSSLLEIKAMIQEDPKLKYAPRVAHYTFWTLIKTDPEKAAKYGRELMKSESYEDPPYKSITDAVSYMVEIKKATLPGETYEVGAEAYQAQIDNYPWSMDIPRTYDKIAALYFLAGNKIKSVEAEKKAIEAGKNKKDFPPAELELFGSRLKDYMKM